MVSMVELVQKAQLENLEGQERTVNLAKRGMRDQMELQDQLDNGYMGNIQ